MSSLSSYVGPPQHSSSDFAKANSSKQFNHPLRCSATQKGRASSKMSKRTKYQSVNMKPQTIAGAGNLDRVFTRRIMQSERTASTMTAAIGKAAPFHPQQPHQHTTCQEDINHDAPRECIHQQRDTGAEIAALAKLTLSMLPKGTAKAMTCPPFAARGQTPSMLTQHMASARPRRTQVDLCLVTIDCSRPDPAMERLDPPKGMADN